MAIAATIHWEVRTTGDDLNGGGFKAGASGTDYSQQDSPQLSNTDLALVTSTTCSSAGSPFTSASVGNLIQQPTTAGGFTAGFYEVISVTAGVATVDRSMGTGGSTGGTFRLGGGLLTIAKVVTAFVSGNTIWLASGTYTVTTAITGGAGQADISLIGYLTTHGASTTGTNRPLITTATNSIHIFNMTSSTFTNSAFKNLRFSNTAGTRFDGLHSGSGQTNIVVDNCQFDGHRYAINGNYNVDFNYPSLVCVNTEIKNCTIDGIINSATTVIIGCYIHNNTGEGANLNRAQSAGPIIVINCVFYANGSHGIESAAAGLPLICINSVFADNTGDGIKNLAGNTGCFIKNCILYNNGGYGINFATGGIFLLALNDKINLVNYNAFRLNTSGAVSGLTAGANDVTLTVDPFTDRTTADFSLNATAGGGAALKAVGFPGVSLFGTGNLDIGAVQSAGSGGGGSSGMFYVPNLNGV